MEDMTVWCIQHNRGQVFQGWRMVEKQENDDNKRL